MRRAWLWVVIALLTSSGCAQYGTSLLNPGSTDQQQARALFHDPYPDPDAGPNVDDVRPQGYVEPAPEPVRTQSYAPLWRRPFNYRGR